MATRTGIRAAGARTVGSSPAAVPVPWLRIHRRRLSVSSEFQNPESWSTYNRAAVPVPGPNRAAALLPGILLRRLARMLPP
jgi:hypothetical protein